MGGNFMVISVVSSMIPRILTWLMGLRLYHLPRGDQGPYKLSWVGTGSLDIRLYWGHLLSENHPDNGGGRSLLYSLESIPVCLLQYWIFLEWTLVQTVSFTWLLGSSNWRCSSYVNWQGTRVYTFYIPCSRSAHALCLPTSTHYTN